MQIILTLIFNLLVSLKAQKLHLKMPSFCQSTINIFQVVDDIRIKSQQNQNSSMKIKCRFLFVVGNVVLSLVQQRRKLRHHFCYPPVATNSPDTESVLNVFVQLNILSFTESLIVSFNNYLLMTYILPVPRGSTTIAFCVLVPVPLYIIFSL